MPSAEYKKFRIPGPAPDAEKIATDLLDHDFRMVQGKLCILPPTRPPGYCIIGALLSFLGFTDEELSRMDSGLKGPSFWRNEAPPVEARALSALRTHYGLKFEHVRQLMSWNDNWVGPSEEDAFDPKTMKFDLAQEILDLYYEKANGLLERLKREKEAAAIRTKGSTE